MSLMSATRRLGLASSSCCSALSCFATRTSGLRLKERTNMRKALILIAPAILLAGCGAFGGKQKSLDEFAVARNAPLVIPPDYSLTPPVAGTVSMTAQD